MSAILMSIQPRYADLLLGREKVVEFRKKFPILAPGTMIALYASSPTSAIVGVCEVTEVRVLPLRDLWTLAKNVPGESRQEFGDYYKDTETGTAIFVKNARRVRPIPLEVLRDWYDLEPPMSWRYLPAPLARRLQK